MGSVSYRGRSAVGSGQQGVETIVCAGIISFMVDVAVVEAAADKRSLVHKHGAITSVVSGLIQPRVLRAEANIMAIKRRDDAHIHSAHIFFQMKALKERMDIDDGMVSTSVESLTRMHLQEGSQTYILYNLQTTAIETVKSFL